MRRADERVAERHTRVTSLLAGGNLRAVRLTGRVTITFWLRPKRSAHKRQLVVVVTISEESEPRVTPEVIVEAVRGHRQWYTPFVGGGSAFEHKGERMLDARTLFHYAATGISPAMAAAQPGSGSAYIYTARDSNGRYFEGGKTYKVTIPAPVPAALFWSFSIYDNQHRSFLETDQKLAGIDCTFPAMKKNADGSATVWFSPNAPAGQEGNWVQTVPGKGWFTMFRLYGPLQPWFDKTWQPGDFKLVP